MSTPKQPTTATDPPTERTMRGNGTFAQHLAGYVSREGDIGVYRTVHGHVLAVYYDGDDHETRIEVFDSQAQFLAEFADACPELVEEYLNNSPGAVGGTP